MKQVVLILSLALAAPVVADDRHGLLVRCAELPPLTEAVAIARSGYDGLIAAMREVPDLAEVEKFGYSRLFVQEMIRRIDWMHGHMTPEEIGRHVKQVCVQSG